MLKNSTTPPPTTTSPTTPPPITSTTNYPPPTPLRQRVHLSPYRTEQLDRTGAGNDLFYLPDTHVERRAFGMLRSIQSTHTLNDILEVQGDVRPCDRKIEVATCLRGEKKKIIEQAEQKPEEIMKIWTSGSLDTKQSYKRYGNAGRDLKKVISGVEDMLLDFELEDGVKKLIDDVDGGRRKKESRRMRKTLLKRTVETVKNDYTEREQGEERKERREHTLKRREAAAAHRRKQLADYYEKLEEEERRLCRARENAITLFP